MATTDGTDARILASAVALTAVVLPVIGLTTTQNAPYEWSASTLVPLLLAVAGFLVMPLIVDPMLTLRNPITRDAVHIWLSKTFMYRLPAIELPALTGLLIALIEQERSVLFMGALGTLVLATVWWPGEQFFGVMRRRLQPLSADKLMDELLTSSNGRLFLKTR
jgi:hypothetical protein